MPASCQHGVSLVYWGGAPTLPMKQAISLNLIRAVFVLITTAVGVSIAMGQWPERGWIGAYGGFAFGVLVVLLDMGLRDFSIRGFSTGTFGLLVGLLCAWLVTRIDIFRSGWFGNIELAGELFQLGVYLAFGFLGVMLALRSKREEFSLLIPYVRFRQDSVQEWPTLLDSNVIIDGRIADVCATGFLGGSLIVPRFVLDELQRLADSRDELKRLRGKRGLDCLDGMQNGEEIDITVLDEDVPEEDTVDGKLAELGKRLGARILTNDANLAKVARLKDVAILSFNELAAALKPKVEPGDEIDLELVKEGKDEHQAVGYLPDGTMIVVNQGADCIGTTRSVVVAGSVQTSAGRLIFAELKS